MNRRDFLLATATTAAGMSASSYARVLGANDRVGLGIIGVGRRGTMVGGAFLQDDRVRLVAVSDVYDAQTTLFLSRLPGSAAKPKTTDAYESLLAQKDVDAVVIATPDHLHVKVAVDALAAGMHVYLEKPTLHRWSERAVIESAAQKQKLVLQCGMQQRSGAHYLRVKEEIFAQGKLGKVVFARAVWHNFPWQQRNIKAEPKPANLDWNAFLGPAPRVPYETIRYTAWRYFPDYGNGLLADILTHWVDVAQWMLDDARPLRASALGGIYQLHDGRENPDTVSAIIQYDGWNLNFESSVLSICDDRPSVFFEGTEGNLDLAREGYIYTSNQGEAVSVNSTEDLERAHARNFLDAVIQGSQVNAPLQAGIDASRPVQMALKSYWTNKTVSNSELS